MGVWAVHPIQQVAALVAYDGRPTSPHVVSAAAAPERTIRESIARKDFARVLVVDETDLQAKTFSTGRSVSDAMLIQRVVLILCRLRVLDHLASSKAKVGIPLSLFCASGAAYTAVGQSTRCFEAGLAKVGGHQARNSLKRAT